MDPTVLRLALLMKSGGQTSCGHLVLPAVTSRGLLKMPKLNEGLIRVKASVLHNLR